MDNCTPSKRCSRNEQCVHPEGPWLPATTEYFWRDSTRRDGLQSSCIACRSAAKKQRRQSDPAKAREQDKKDRDKHRDIRKEQSHNWRLKNIEHALRYDKEYKHRPEVRERNKERKRTRRKEKPDEVRDEYNRWLDKNPDYHKEWRARHPDLTKQIKLTRRAREKSLPDKFAGQDWQNALDHFGNCCAVCGRQIPNATHSAAADHWLPLSKGGGSTPDNIVPLCHSKKGGRNGCNNRKLYRDPIEFLETEFEEQAQVILKRIEFYFERVKTSH